MWVRGVAAALAAWCVSGVALAANYSEVWNPPEAAGHVLKQSKKTAGGANVKTDVHVKNAAKSGSRPGSRADVKPGSKAAAKLAGRSSAKHVASDVTGGAHPAHSGSHIASANAGKAGKAGQHGQVKKVAGKNGAAVNPNAAKKKPKAPLMVQSGTPRAHYVQAGTAQRNVMSAGLAPGRATHPQAVNVAAKSAAPATPTTVANAGAKSARSGAANSVIAETNPATASSGSLPPILH